MKRDRLQKKVFLLPMLFERRVLTAVIIIIAGFMTPAFGDDSISVSCYRDGGSSWSLGSVVVFDVAEAAQACNAVYYDCRGRCIGCFHDFDYVDNVCIDMQGNKFLR